MYYYNCKKLIIIVTLCKLYVNSGSDSYLIFYYNLFYVPTNEKIQAADCR